VTARRRCILPFLLLPLLTVTHGCTRPDAASAPSGTAFASGGASPAPASASSARIVFRDVAGEAGLSYRWKLAEKPVRNILELIGNGCAFLDYDNDGNLDILLVGPKLALYKGDGKGRFTDVSGETGVGTLNGHFLGCATGDFNNDGFLDVYVLAYRGGALLRNENGKTFREVTNGSGLAAQPWATAAAFADLDRDGNPDLYIGNYVRFGPETVPQLCTQKGIQTACAPRQYPPEPGFLYRGDGKGRFTDITKAAGFDKMAGKALGVAVADYDGSGRLSVAVANDEMPGDLMKNSGGVRFENIARMAGTATDSDGNLHGGMGTDWGDVDGDGRLDLFVGTYQNEIKNIYRNDGDDLFTDKSAALGLNSSLPYVTFGARFTDFDNDGVLDLVIANGHVQDNIERIDPRTRFLQPTLFYQGVRGAPFVDITAAQERSVTRPIMGRGLATGDYDNDGRVDVLVVDSNGAPLLLRNESVGSGRFLGVALDGAGRVTTPGALLTLKAGGRTLVRHYHTDGSYLSASDPRVVFGLGAEARIETLMIRWPDGKTEIWRDLPADRYHTLAYGTGTAEGANQP
jgi:enediyne biosynthesis protein E4